MRGHMCSILCVVLLLLFPSWARACEPGTFRWQTSLGGTTRVVCRECPVGMYCATVDAAEPTYCPANTYQPLKGQSSAAACLPCPHDLVSMEASYSLAHCQPTYNPFAFTDSVKNVVAESPALNSDTYPGNKDGPPGTAIFNEPFGLTASYADPDLVYFSDRNKYGYSLRTVRVAAPSRYYVGSVPSTASPVLPRAVIPYYTGVDGEFLATSYAGFSAAYIYLANFSGNASATYTAVLGNGQPGGVMGCGDSAQVSGQTQVWRGNGNPNMIKSAARCTARAMVERFPLENVAVTFETSAGHRFRLLEYDGDGMCSRELLPFEYSGGDYVTSMVSSGSNAAHVYMAVYNQTHNLQQIHRMSPWSSSPHIELMRGEATKFFHLKEQIIWAAPYNGRYIFSSYTFIQVADMRSGAVLTKSCGGICGTRLADGVCFGEAMDSILLGEGGSQHPALQVHGLEYRNCAAGSYRVGIDGMFSCFPCEAGTFKAHVGPEACAACPAGTTSAVGSASAADCVCVAGTFQWPTSLGGTTRIVCRDCPVGMYCATEGATEPTYCPPDTYQPLKGQSSAAACVPCPHGLVSMEASYSLVHCQPTYNPFAFTDNEVNRVFENVVDNGQYTGLVDGLPGVAEIQQPYGFSASYAHPELVYFSARDSTYSRGALRTVRVDGSYRIGSIVDAAANDTEAALPVSAILYYAGYNETFFASGQHVPFRSHIYEAAVRGDASVTFTPVLGDGTLGPTMGCGAAAKLYLQAQWHGSTSPQLMKSAASCTPREMLEKFPLEDVIVMHADDLFRLLEYDGDGGMCSRKLADTPYGSNTAKVMSMISSGSNAAHVYMSMWNTTGGGAQLHRMRVWDPAPAPVILYESQGSFFHDTRVTIVGAPYNGRYLFGAYSKLQVADVRSGESITKDCGSTCGKAMEDGICFGEAMDSLVLGEVGVERHALQVHGLEYRNCAAGSYRITIDGMFTCFPCEAGTFKAHVGPEACTACPAGMTSAVGSTSVWDCVCDPGTFRWRTSLGGAERTVCRECLVGMYCGEVNATEPTYCPPDTYQPLKGQTSAAACLPCPHGLVSMEASYSLVHCQPTYNPFAFTDDNLNEVVVSNASAPGDVDGPPGVASFEGALFGFTVSYEHPDIVYFSKRNNDFINSLRTVRVAEPGLYDVGSLALDVGRSPLLYYTGVNSSFFVSSRSATISSAEIDGDASASVVDVLGDGSRGDVDGCGSAAQLGYHHNTGISGNPYLMRSAAACTPQAMLDKFPLEKLIVDHESYFAIKFRLLEYDGTDVCIRRLADTIYKDPEFDLMSMASSGSNLAYVYLHVRQSNPRQSLLHRLSPWAEDPRVEVVYNDSNVFHVDAAQIIGAPYNGRYLFAVRNRYEVLDVRSRQSVVKKCGSNNCGNVLADGACFGAAMDKIIAGYAPNGAPRALQVHGLEYRNCAAGSERVTIDGMFTCFPCVNGTFKAHVGPEACAECAAGTYSAGGATACTVCEEGTFSGPGAAGCAACPGDTSAPAGSTSAAACSCAAGYVQSASMP